MRGWTASIWVSLNDEGSLYVRFKYDEQMVMKIREMTGRKWIRDKKVWMIPLQSNRFNSCIHFLKEQ